MPEPGSARAPRDNAPIRTSAERWRRYTVMTAFGSAALAGLLATVLWRPLPRLIWNASASSPVGLYAVWQGSPVRLGDMVVAWPPEAARALGAARRYIPRNVPLVKRVAAIAGTRVCAEGDLIRIDGAIVAQRRANDPSGRSLPWWHGCVRLGPGEVFLLSKGASAAFDGRYFGVTAPSLVVGRARLLWRR